MPVSRPETCGSRVIAHIDMDCFYVQVEQRKQPSLRGQPAAVVQYNSWKGGGLIAVSYEARKFGVKRSMRGEEAKHVCPQIQLVQVPVARGKADLSTYRNAGSEVVSILARKGRCERASIDEVYLDITDAAEVMMAEVPPENLEEINKEALKSHVLGLDVDGNDAVGNVREWLCRSGADHRDKLLACGALIVAELRLQVLQETEFTCSAGVAHNKMLAKLASGMNKPAQQTIVPLSSVKGLLEPLPIKKMKQLGGKLGSSLQIDLGVNTVGDLLQFSEEKLQEHYGINNGTWLWNIARGISGEEVEGRILPKSHGSGKTFPGPQALKTFASVEHWLSGLCEELSERLQSDLEQNKRVAHSLTLHARGYKSGDSDLHKKFPSKSCPLRYGIAKIQEDALNLFQAGLREYLGFYGVRTQGNQCTGWGITALSVSASKIVAIPHGTCSIMRYFHNQDQPYSVLKQLTDGLIHEAGSLSPSGSESYSGLHLPEPKIEFFEEEREINYTILNWDQEKDGRMACKESKDEGTYVNKRPADELGPSEVELNQQTAVLYISAESGSGNKPSQRLLEFPREEAGVKYGMHAMRPQKERRKTLKGKGNASILRFFQSRCSCSSPKQDVTKISKETKASLLSESQSLCNSCSGPTEGDQYQGSFGPNEIQRNTWNYKFEEIDTAVVDELPPEIQEEIQAWLRPHKRRANNTVKEGSSITHYFLPTRN